MLSLVKMSIKLDVNLEENNTAGIYLMYCLETDRGYLGESGAILGRCRRHRTDLENKNHPHPEILKSWDNGTLEFYIVSKEPSLINENNRKIVEYTIWSEYKDYLYNSPIPKPKWNISEDIDPNKNPQGKISKQLAGIYCIKNKVNGILLIGEAKNLCRRMNVHRYLAKKGTHKNSAKKQ